MSFNFGHKPLKVRLPKRMCLSKNAISNATHGTIATTPTIPERTECQELKFNTETAENKSEKVQVEKSPTTTAFNTVIISVSARERDKANAGKSANNTT